MRQTTPHRRYRHEALLYEGDEAFLAGTVDFVREGLKHDQPVLVAVPATRLRALADVLGPQAREVELVDMVELGRNPARIIPAWRDFVDRRGGGRRPLRGVGEPVWSGRREAELDECLLHEALLNLAVNPDEPLWLRCPYDVARLAPTVVERARHSHPELVARGEYHGSTAYGGLAHVEEIFAGALPESPAAHTVLEFTAADLADLRHSISTRARGLGLGPDRAADVGLAVTELATNSLRHGGGHGRLRTWDDADALVCEVSDTGLIIDPLVGRRRPGQDAESGRGVWMANQLCDLVQVRSSRRGTVVRVVVWLG